MSVADIYIWIMFCINPKDISESHIFLIKAACNLHLMNQMQPYSLIFSRYLQYQIYKYTCSFIKILT